MAGNKTGALYVTHSLEDEDYQRLKQQKSLQGLFWQKETMQKEKVE